MGAIHPVLFFMFVYGISLFLAFFVCRTVYYSINGNSASKAEVKSELNTSATAMNSTVLK
jgi:hypothetical protein